MSTWGSMAITSVVVLAAGCGASPPAERTRADAAPIPVAVETAQLASWTSAHVVSGSVEPFRRATPGTILTGRVARIQRREGDRVAAGAVIAEIDSQDVTARRAQAVASLAAAGAGEENARVTRERLERLLERNAASRQSVDDAMAGWKAAVAGREAAEQAVRAADSALSYAQVRAPFAGVVTQRHVEVGDLAAPGMPLFVIEDLSRVKIEARVPESAVAALHPGVPVNVVVDAAGATPRAGTIAEILPAADPGSRTFLVRVVLDNADRSLRAGMFARLSLPGTARQAVAAPESALVRRGGLTGLYVVDGSGVARLRWVGAGATRDGRVEILTGVEPGERLVTSPPALLADGRRVQVRG